MPRLLSGATALLFALGPVPAQAPADARGPDARQIHWQRSLEDALAVAEASGRPLFLALNMDGESASDRIVHENYRDPAFVALTRRCVCLAASVFRHNPRDHDDHGRRIPCPRLGEITCGEHMALEPVVFEKYLSDGERVAPRHALVRLDGGKAFDLSLCFDLKDIDRALAEALTAEPKPAEPEAAWAEDWAALAARRDGRGREQLEAALYRARDPRDVLAALGAIESHGDAGSLEALRILLARAHELSVPEIATLFDCCRRVVPQADGFAAVGDLVQSAGELPGGPGPDPRQRVLLIWAERLEPTRSQQSFLLAARAAGITPTDMVGEMVAHTAAQLQSVELSGVVRDHGGPVRLAAFLRTANAVVAGESGLPREGGPTDAMPEAEALRRELEELDAAGDESRTLADWCARFAKASLDLGRRRIETGDSGAELLFEDAAIYFAKALEKEPDHYEWWIERARAAYFLQRYQDQVEYGRRALRLAGRGGDLPKESDLLDDPALRDARVIEALRWIGDGHARLLGARAQDAPEVELVGFVDGLRALGVAAASPFGGEKDWVGFASFCGAIGLHREELAVALCGALRYPASSDLRQTLNAALWSCGRPELSGVVADRIARSRRPSADASWHSGYAWMLVAEDARRRERPVAAIRHYDTASARFHDAAQRNPDYAPSCRWWQAAAAVGQGLASARSGERRSAADFLRHAIELHADLTGLRDGLGYDVLDLVDKTLEWRADGPSPVRPLALLDRIDELAPDDPFWAVAVSDSTLREALRADGRNPERRERETVDAAGEPITMPMGLPTRLGDEYLAASIEAGRRAARRARTDDDRRPLAQSLTIFAERQFERGRIDGEPRAHAEAAHSGALDVRRALTEAAEVMGLEPPGEDADEAALRALAARLRGLLGPARPRLRQGR